MVIRPVCERCGKVLEEFGGLIFGPPGKDMMARKHHLCVECYKQITGSFT